MSTRVTPRPTRVVRLRESDAPPHRTDTHVHDQTRPDARREWVIRRDPDADPRWPWVIHRWSAPCQRYHLWTAEASFTAAIDRVDADMYPQL